MDLLLNDSNNIHSWEPSEYFKKCNIAINAISQELRDEYKLEQVECSKMKCYENNSFVDMIILDLETTGLIKGKYKKYTDLDAYPRIIEAAWYNTKTGKTKSYLINCSECNDAEKINGITKEMMCEGKDIKEVLTELMIDIKDCGRVIAHNLTYFDCPILLSELYRNEMLDDARWLNENIKLYDSKKWFMTIIGGMRGSSLANMYLRTQGTKCMDDHRAVNGVNALNACYEYVDLEKSIVEQKEKCW